MSRSTRSRMAREIMHKKKIQQAEAGVVTQPGPHPLLLVFTLASTLFFVIFWALLREVLAGVRDPSFNSWNDQIVSMGATGFAGLLSPLMWWALLSEALPRDSKWRHPVRALVTGLAHVASPDDAAWREEWPALLIRRSGEPRRPVRTTLTVTGWAWAALRSRAAWMLDVCLQSDTVCALATFGATGVAWFAAWDAAGMSEAIATAIVTFIGCIAAVDGLCRWRGIKLPRPKKK
ncbi:hypothetical protein [Streptomyces mirabilis]|uniref:hypothetical protein n=1 Tax=Streptomyces mirabilis TaxID=68239 RepID=UPI003825619C